MKHQRSLEGLFCPDSVVVIGASTRPSRIGTQVYENVKRFFPGKVWGVNPRFESSLEHGTFASIEELPGPVGLAVMLVPAERVLADLKSCAVKGIRNVLVISAGFAEIGGEGARLQGEIEQFCADHGIVLLGPNCVGFMNLHRGLMPTFALNPQQDVPRAGGVALVSQSGGFGSFILGSALTSGLDVGWFVSTGNELQVSVAEVLEFLVEQPEVGVLLAFAESVRDLDSFIRTAECARELGKPFAMLKAGRSEAAARAAISHTGSMVGSAQVFDAICDQYGVLRTSTMQELIDLGTVLQTGRRPAGSALGILTSSGGAGVLLADSAGALGLDVPEIESEFAARIEAAMPQPFFGTCANPVDSTASLISDPDAYGQVVETMFDCPQLDALVVVTWELDAAVRGIIRAAEASPKPIAVVSPEPITALREAGVPVFTDPHRAVAALAGSARFAELSRQPRAGRPGDPVELSAKARDVLAGAVVLNEFDSKQVLAEAGVPVVEEHLATSAAHAAELASQLGGPVVLKIVAEGLAHKSDVGGVRVGVEPAGAATEHDELISVVKAAVPDAAVEGVLVQAMVPARLEMICGVSREPLLGPVVTIGLGGTQTEVISLTAVLRPPFSHDQAVRLIEGMAEGRLVSASRGLSGDEVAALAEVMVRLGDLVLSHPEIEEIDLNPLRVSGGRAVAVDALIVTSGTARE